MSCTIDISDKKAPKIINSIEENKEIVTLIWFDPIMESSDNTKETKENLSIISNFILFLTNVESCINYIKSVKHERILLILSGNNAFRILPSIINLSQLDSVFIFPDDREKYKRLLDDFCKIVGIFDQSDELIKALQQSTKHINRQRTVTLFYDQNQRSTCNLAEESTQYLWFQLFHDVIRHLPHDDKAKEEMLSACRQYYRNNHRILQDIDKFEKTYHKDECIQWYTKNTFVFRLINKALRTQDIEQLYIFRYFIADLSKQLAYEFNNLKSKVEDKICLYRGTTLKQAELEALKKNEGKLIATNNYWSTTCNRSTALTFVNNYFDTIAILIEIECHLKDCQNSVIVADISSLSEFPTEEEYLFDASSIFQIGKILEENINDQILYIIQLKTTNESYDFAKNYIEENRKQMEEEGPRVMLSILLKRLGKFKKSLKFLQYLRDNPGQENLAYIYNRIGVALKDDNKCEEALEYLTKAFKLSYYSNLPNRKYAAYVLHNQGLVYYKQSNYHQALTYYQRAINILETETENNSNCVLAQIYSSIGRIYQRKREFDKALEYQLTALQIREIIMTDHVINAFSYADIGNIYSIQQNYTTALEYHLKALNLRIKFLPANSHNIAWSQHQVGKLYYNMNDFEKSREHYFKSLQIKETYKGSAIFDSIPALFEDIALTYNDDLQQALHYRQRALEFFKNAKRIDYSYMANVLDNIAFTYRLMGQTNESLRFYHQALKIRKEKLYNNHFNLSHSYYHLASMGEEIGDLPSALSYYQEALKIYEYYCHYHDYRCKETRKCIQRVKQRISLKYYS